MKAELRGSLYEQETNIDEVEVSTTLFKDNKLVYMLSTFSGEQPKQKFADVTKELAKTSRLTVLPSFVNTTSIWELLIWSIVLLEDTKLKCVLTNCVSEYFIIYLMLM
jgi:hypothetical protein